MTDIHYQDLARFLQKEGARRAPSWPPVWLLFGEEMLYKKALEKVLTAILGDVPRHMTYEAIDGLNENVRGTLERINTYSLLSDRKIVALTDARIFHSRQNLDRLWDQATRSGKAGDMKKAARLFLDFLSIHRLALADLAGASPETVLKQSGAGDDMEWVPAVLDYCRQRGLDVPSAANPQQELQDAVLRGFPPGHHLVITTDLVDKRRTLYKTIRENGLVVDCSVPKGERKADRTAQDAALDTAVEDVLRDSGKRMDPAVRRVMYDMTGFDLRTVVASVEKLVNYVGDRRAIETADVRQTLERTRRDPLYELTEAISDRNLSKALFFLQSLLTSGEFDHPLPLLAAVTNRMRRLLVAKDFTTSTFGRVWHAGCSYPQFQTQVMPAIKAFDDALQTKLDAWDQALTPVLSSEGKKKGAGKKKRKPRSDLFLAGNGRSPYPVYKTLQKAERFTHLELTGAVRQLSEADRQMKRSGLSGQLILEHVIFSICQAGQSAKPSGKPGRGRPSNRH
jgi:DNA polymerase III subunit delta